MSDGQNNWSDDDGVSLDQEPSTAEPLKGEPSTVVSFALKGAHRLRGGPVATPCKPPKDEAPPYRKHYPAQMLTATRNFSTLEYGALITLMDCFWCEGRLPSDDDEVRRLAKLSKPQWAKSRARLAAKFDPHWTHDELAAERADTAANIRSKRKSGQLGGLAKAARLADES
jgi:uncharacterized protein YdaU (DUF1376 family)